MARKSNKTEQVLKLITKDEETIDSLVEKEEPKEEPKEEVKAPVVITDKKQEEAASEPEVMEAKPAAVKQHPEEKNISDLLDKYDQLVNISEVLVRERIELVMERMNVCTCTSCVNDILALALNALPTKYVTTDVGKQYSQLEIYKKQYETDVLAALTKACVRVKAAPRH